MTTLEALQQTKRVLTLRNYSYRTHKNYLFELRHFFEYYEPLDPEDLEEAQIKDYIYYKIDKHRIGSSRQNMIINAIKFYYEKVWQHRRKFYRIERPRKSRFLPNVLTETEVKTLFDLTENLKHRTILYTIYSGGLRLNELVNLKLKDIDSKMMSIKIVKGKGKKDRYVPLSRKVLVKLREYFKIYRPSKWLIENPNGGQYSTRSIQNIMARAVRKAGISKVVTVHTLRHSYASHLLNNGVSIKYIQDLLGHNSIKTTMIYLHVNRKTLLEIESPIENII